MTAACAEKQLCVVVPIVAGVGNALMAVPMVRQIRRNCPDAQVHVVARIDAMAEPFRRLPEVASVSVSGGGARGVGRMILQMRRHDADVCLVPFPSNRWQYEMLAAASGAERRVMHSYPIGRWRALHFLPAERVPARRGLHDVVQNLNLLRQLEIEPDLNEAPQFIVNDADRAQALTMLRDAGLAGGEPFIAIHPGSARTVLARAKRWPPAQYARLVPMLRAQLGLEVLLLEGPDEAGVGEQILAHLPQGAAVPRVLRCTGGLGAAAGVLQRAALYIGSDSGLAHLAAAVGRRAVTLFAPADPDRVCPFGNRDLVVQPACDCCPCFDYPWKSTRPRMRHTTRCIERIAPEMVMAAVRRVPLDPVPA